MVKRISCKVICSKPLSNKSEILQYINKLSNNRHRIDNTAAREPQVNHTRNSFTNSQPLDMIKESIDNRLIGQILDYYV